MGTSKITEVFWVVAPHGVVWSESLATNRDTCMMRFAKSLLPANMATFVSYSTAYQLFSLAESAGYRMRSGTLDLAHDAE